MNMRRLPLEGLKNCRDLGGFPIAGGGVTRYHEFLRCEVPHLVTDNDIKYLLDYGLKTSIDFMGDSEIKVHASKLEFVPEIKYIRCPTFSRQVAGEKGTDIRHIDTFVDWGRFYVGMLHDNGSWVRNVLETAASSEGGVMYNCATGKDRTGIISAILLGLAGVCDEDIIADYCVSMVYLRSVYSVISAHLCTKDENGNLSFDGPFFHTDPKNMEQMLDHINENFGSIESYVLSLGTDKGAVEEIKHRLTKND